MSDSISVAELDAFVHRNPDDYVDTSCDPFIPEVLEGGTGYITPERLLRSIF